MTVADYLEIGVLVKLHGFKGEYVMVSDTIISEEIEDWESVFIEIDGLPVPFFIDTVRFLTDNSVVIGFEDLNSETVAKEFVGCRVLQTSELFCVESQDEASRELAGFKVIDPVAGEIGIVEQILNYNQNYLLQVMNGDEEILIPVSDQIIVSVNHESKLIVVNLPEGLLDLNK